MKVEITRDALDYAEAVGVLLSAIVAVVALLIARSSARDSHASAKAARATAESASQQVEATKRLIGRVEEQLDIEREQHEALMEDRARRPILVPNLVAKKRGDALGGSMMFVIEGSLRNDGDKTAEQVLARFLTPDNVQLAVCNSEGLQRGPQLFPDKSEDSPLEGGRGGLRPAQFHDQRIDSAPGPAHAFHMAVTFPATTGTFKLWLVLHHPELDSPVSAGLEIWFPQPGGAIGANQLRDLAPGPNPVRT